MDLVYFTGWVLLANHGRVSVTSLDWYRNFEPMYNPAAIATSGNIVYIQCSIYFY